MKMKVTIQQVVDASLGLTLLSRLSFRNSKLSYSILRNVRVVRPIAEDFEKSKSKLVDDFGGVSDGVRVNFKDTETRIAFQAQYNELLKTEEELEIWQMSTSALFANDLVRGSEGAGVTPEEVILLGPFALDDMPE